MKLILFFVISCLALHNGNGAPRTAVYKFVRCNPEGDQANCVTQQSPEMAYTPDLPAKLPASTALYLEAVPEEEELEVEEDEKIDEGKSPEVIDDGSGGYEGSAAEDTLMADRAFVTAESESGSGESWAEQEAEPDKGENKWAMRRLFPNTYLVGEDKPVYPDLREDHLLQL